MVMFKPGECSFIRWLRKRHNHHNNTLIMMQGETGSGKSYSAIQKTSEYDPEFRIEQVVRNFREFMELIKQDWFIKKKNKIVIFDEPQVSISNRNWQSLTNKLMNYLLSTFRHQQIVVFFVAPYKTFLDSQSMKLIHCVMTTKGINRDKKLCAVRFTLEQYNPDMDKFYHHPLFVLSKFGIQKLNELNIHKPNKKLIEQYEQRKHEFTSNLNIDILKQIIKLENKNAGIVEPKPIKIKEPKIVEPKPIKIKVIKPKVIKIKLPPNITCRSCGYSWHKRSNNSYLKCPKCCHVNIINPTTMTNLNQESLRNHANLISEEAHLQK